MDFLQRTPFLRLLLPFIVGIILYQYVNFVHWSLHALFFVSLFLIILSFRIRVPKRQFEFRWLFGCGISIFMLALAYFLSGAQEKRDAFDHLNKKGIYKVELTSAPIEKENSYLCKVSVLNFFDSSWKPARGQAMLYFQKDKSASKLLFGDRLLVQAEFAPPEKPLNPDGFDYVAYLNRQGIGAVCYIPTLNWEKIGRNTAFSIRREADKCRNYLLAMYRKFNIQGDEFAVLAAITLGYTDSLQPDLRASYSATGAMHILAVSGLHVGVVYVVLAFLLGFLNKTQRQKIAKTIFITLFLWAYAFLTGLSPSVFRATLMFSFVAVATCLKRKSQIQNTIFMSAFFMLLFNPNLLFNVGFQLSYSAVLSIIIFQPSISKLLQPNYKVTRWTWDIMAVSIAAQLGTAPFTLYYFQQFPNYFLLTNLVAIPLSSVIIYLGIALLSLSYIPFISVLIAFLLKWSLWLLNFLIVGIQNLPFSLSYISFDIRQTFLIFTAVFCLTAYFYTKKFTPVFISLISVLLVCIFSLSVNYQTLTSKKIIVYAGQKGTHVSFVNRNVNYIYSTDSTEIKRIGKMFWRNHKFGNPIFIMHNKWFSNGFGEYENSKVLILTQDFLSKKSTFKPLTLDYLVIGNKLKPKINQILESVNPKIIIVDKSISKWYTDNIRQVCKTRHIEFYSVAERGAYICNIKD